MFKILCIEDNEDLQRELKNIISSNGYEFYCADNRKRALSILKSDTIDLCLIDVGLPDCSGFDLCEEIRSFFMSPIIMLTAHDTEDDIVFGLHKGADDYITKPFSIKLLLSRLEAHLRRKTWQKSDMHKIVFSGDLEINFDIKKIFKDNQEISLRKVEFDICSILLENNGRIIKREQLLDRIWDSNNKFVEDNTLTVHISRLRKQLRSFQGTPYIETVKGFGYRWCVDIIKK